MTGETDRARAARIPDSKPRVGAAPASGGRCSLQIGHFIGIKSVWLICGTTSSPQFWHSTCAAKISSTTSSVCRLTTAISVTLRFQHQSMAVRCADRTRTGTDQRDPVRILVHQVIWFPKAVESVDQMRLPQPSQELNVSMQSATRQDAQFARAEDSPAVLGLIEWHACPPDQPPSVMVTAQTGDAS